MRSIKLLNIRIDCPVKEELGKLLKASYLGSDKIEVGKINTEFLLRAVKNQEFRNTINSFDLNIADGSGVLWAAKYSSLPLVSTPFLRQIQAVWQMLYTGLSLIFKPSYCCDVIPERFPGVEALFMMLRLAEKTKAPVFFLGAEKKVSDRLPGRIKKDFPELIIAGNHEGYNLNNEEIIDEINGSKAILLIVALGSPKQEYWIRDNKDKLKSVRVAVGEGGSFDFLVGENKRAPRFMRKAGLEWLWRLFVNTNKTGEVETRSKRRFGRVWQAVPVYVYTVVKYKLKREA